jgi:hypothetical protein
VTKTCPDIYQMMTMCGIDFDKNRLRREAFTDNLEPVIAEHVRSGYVSEELPNWQMSITPDEPLGVVQRHYQFCEANSMPCSPSRPPVKGTGLCHHSGVLFEQQ